MTIRELGDDFLSAEVSELMLAGAVFFGAIAVVCGLGVLVLHVLGRWRGW